MLTKYMKNLIKKGIETTGGKERIKLCEYVCTQMEQRFGDNMEKKLENMEIPTTGRILNVIDSYLSESEEVA